MIGKTLIIGGTSKAGTTSLFNYLAGHPRISPARLKETRFFLDLSYPLPSESRIGRTELVAYKCFFDRSVGDCESVWQMEATPDYLHSEFCAASIAKALPSVSFVFVLREPIARLLSWYRFGQSINEIAKNISFDQYVREQRARNAYFGEGCGHPAHFALQQGNYSFYLRRFVDVFGAAAVNVRFFEDLRRDPRTFMVSICEAINISSDYFDDFKYAIANKGVSVRNPALHRTYVRTKERFRRAARGVSVLGPLFRSFGGFIDSNYKRVNVLETEAISVSDETREFLNSYYQDEPAGLKDLFGVEVPW